jgi:hypothetical protein
MLPSAGAIVQLSDDLPLALWSDQHIRKSFSVKGFVMMATVVASSLSALTATGDSDIAALPAVTNPASPNSATPASDTARVLKDARTSAAGRIITGGAKPICFAPQPHLKKPLWIMLPKPPSLQP